MRNAGKDRERESRVCTSIVNFDRMYTCPKRAHSTFVRTNGTNPKTNPLPARSVPHACVASTGLHLPSGSFRAVFIIRPPVTEERQRDGVMAFLFNMRAFDTFSSL